MALGTMSIDDIFSAIKLLEASFPDRRGFCGNSFLLPMRQPWYARAAGDAHLSFPGMSIMESGYCLTDERLFPYSRHRSARIHKKLVKRFGGEYRQKPVAYQFGDNLIIHPELSARLRARTGYVGG